MRSHFRQPIAGCGLPVDRYRLERTSFFYIKTNKTMEFKIILQLLFSQVLIAVFCAALHDSCPAVKEGLIKIFGDDDKAFMIVMVPQFVFMIVTCLLLIWSF